MPEYSARSAGSSHGCPGRGAGRVVRTASRWESRFPRSSGRRTDSSPPVCRCTCTRSEACSRTSSSLARRPAEKSPKRPRPRPRFAVNSPLVASAANGVAGLGNTATSGSRTASSRVASSAAAATAAATAPLSLAAGNDIGKASGSNDTVVPAPAVRRKKSAGVTNFPSTLLRVPICRRASNHGLAVPG